jgi:hypothetical protein
MLNKKLSAKLCAAARSYHELRASATGESQTLLLSIMNDMHTLDAKSTGLITFISLIIAALTFALSLVDQHREWAHGIKAGLIFFIAIFALAAWFSLRCLEMSGPPFTQSCADTEIHVQQSFAEIATRRYNYFVSLRITRAAFILLVPFVITWVSIVAWDIY